jgi:hypothetical protein
MSAPLRGVCTPAGAQRDDELERELRTDRLLEALAGRRSFDVQAGAVGEEQPQASPLPPQVRSGVHPVGSIGDVSDTRDP